MMNEISIALAGNPNVGKSTLFNALTGLNQHTGNWAGKTVMTAEGKCVIDGHTFRITDLPGTYSLYTCSPEEKHAEEFLLHGKYDMALVVCDATCLERSLILALQIRQICQSTAVCINLMDEASRRHIKIDLALLEELLDMPVITTSANRRKNIRKLKKDIASISFKDTSSPLIYPEELKKRIDKLCFLLENRYKEDNPYWRALCLLEQGNSNGSAYSDDDDISCLLDDSFKNEITEAPVRYAHTCYTLCVREEKNIESGRKDKILTGTFTGYAVMILLLFFILWITITGANYPSQLLFNGAKALEEYISSFLININTPDIIYGVLIDGIYRTATWVIAVMLPPMAIFFPLFSFLEDLGYLPRVAYNLDRPFEKCNACGRQCLTMCMGFGCNAAAVTGARIISSERERLLSIITNSFVPCNGRFPAIIVISSAFISASYLASSAVLTAGIVFSILISMGATYILSKTVLKGTASSYTLELPPFRRPSIKKVLVSSLLERTLFVLRRAAAVAVPAGAILWIFANIHIGELSVLDHAAAFLEPFASLLGFDGYILLAFILGLPANEIVLPIIIMPYLGTGYITDDYTVSTMMELFTDRGWSLLTAFNVIIFYLMHWPCATTLVTIKKETGSLKWTLWSFLVPFICGSIICMITTAVYTLFS